MSEKRFTIEESENQLIIFDNGVSDETYFHLGNDERDVKYVCDLLNEQQATIRRLQDLCGESDGENAKLRLKNKELKEEIKLLKPTNIEQYEQIQKLQEENEKLKNKLNEHL